MKNRAWLWVSQCCEAPVLMKTVPATEAPVLWRQQNPGADGYTVPYCVGCGELNPGIVQRCQPWEAVGLPNPELIERGFSELAPLAARLATRSYLQAIANACAFNKDRVEYESGEDEGRVRYEFKIRMLVED